MILSKSRQTHGDSNPDDIIPISFNMHKALYENYNKIKTKERYLVQTQSQTKSSRIALPEVHGGKKELNMNVLPKKEKIEPQNKRIVKNKPRLGQGRVGIKCKKPQPVDSIPVSTCISCKIPKIPTSQNVTKNNMDFSVQKQLITNKMETAAGKMIPDKNRELPFYPDPIYRPPPRLSENL